MLLLRGWLYLVIIVILMVLLVACGPKSPIYPSYEDLKRRGFYVYVLPEEVRERYRWYQTISISSWDRHCRIIDWSENFNPIIVKYTEGHADSGRIFFMLIGPWNMYWDSTRDTVTVTLNTEWSEDGKARYYYLSEGVVHMRFEDRFGIPVQIISDLPVEEVVSLVNRLEYVGPPPEEVTNPWDPGKCQR